MEGIVIERTPYGQGYIDFKEGKSINENSFKLEKAETAEEVNSFYQWQDGWHAAKQYQEWKSKSKT